MEFVRHLPVKHKVMAITILVNAVALLVALAAFLVFEGATDRKHMVKSLGITAEMTGANITAGLSFNDAASVDEILKSLSAQPDLVQACVYDHTGQVFARYLRAGLATNLPVPAVKPPGARFASQRLGLFQPVQLAGESLGAIYLEQDMSRFRMRLWRCSVIGLAVLAGCGGLAFLLSAWLQKIITEPLAGLATTVAAVRAGKNYSIRAVRQGDDELGNLIDGFNEMLAQIEERDANLERRVTERTRELAESLSVINATLSSTADGILVLNPRGAKIFQNRRAVELWKIPPEVVDAADDVRVRHMLAMAQDPAQLQARRHYFTEHPEAVAQVEVRLKDGSILDCATAPVLDAEGRNYGRIWTFHDVTQSRRYEAALRESEANYHSLVDQLPAGVFRKDKDGRFVFINSWFCRFRGVQPADYVGKLPDEIIAAGTAGRGADSVRLLAVGQQHHRTIMETGRPIFLEEQHPMADGSVVYHHIVKSAVFGPDGTVIGSQGILLDITPRKLAEAKLAYERDLFKALLDQTPDYIYFKDRQSHFVRLSHAVVDHFFDIALARHRQDHPKAAALPPHLADWERFQKFIIGKSDADIYGVADAAEFARDEREILASGKPLLRQIQKVVAPDGRSIWFLTSKAPWKNEYGEIIGTFGTSRNITDLKQAEAQIEQAHRQLLETSRLAGMAEVATSVLHNVGNVLNSVNVSTTLVLDHMKKSRLHQLDRVAGMMHEHRDELAAFLTADPRGRELPGYLRQLATHLGAEQRQLMGEVELTLKNIEHIKDIVAMQQSYAKISGVVETVNLPDLVEDALRMNAGALDRHHVEIVRDFPAERIECQVERPKVLQILINLIRNAKYACEESGRADRRLVVRVRAVGSRAQITVLDNGVGIPPENLTRIFNHGFTTRAHGHGFGLHSGALAARELGGSLTAHSAGPGAGARFDLDLPLQPALDL